MLFVHMLCDFLKPQERLEAGILILWHQLNVVQKRSTAFALHRPRPVHLALSAPPAHSGCHEHRPTGDCRALASQGFGPVLSENYIRT